MNLAIRVFEWLAIIFTVWMAGGDLYQIAMGVAGLLYVFLVRYKKPQAFVFGIIFALMYGIASHKANVLGEYVFNIFITLPMLFYGLYEWFKNEDNKKHTITKDANFKLTVAVLPLFIVFSQTLLSHFGSLSYIIDGASTGTALFATMLMVFRYKNTFTYWTIANLLNTILWIVRGNYLLAVVFTIYLINGLIGIYQWRKISIN